MRVTELIYCAVIAFGGCESVVYPKCESVKLWLGGCVRQVSNGLVAGQSKGCRQSPEVKGCGNMLSPTRPAHSHISAGPVLKPCFDGGFPPEQQATCSPVMLWEMPEVTETVYASSRFWISTLEKRVVLQELIDAQPGIALISGLGSSDRVRDGHEFRSSDSRHIDLLAPLKTTSRTQPEITGRIIPVVVRQPVWRSAGEPATRSDRASTSTSWELGWMQSYRLLTERAVCAVMVLRFSVRRRLTELLPSARASSGMECPAPTRISMRQRVSPASTWLFGAT